MHGAGLEGWMRARGIRPGPVYTVAQLAVVILAIAIGLALFGH